MLQETFKVVGSCLDGQRIVYRELSKKNGFGPWDTIYYSDKAGYFLTGAFGATKRIDKKLGRLYMKGLATPIFWP